MQSRPSTLWLILAVPVMLALGRGTASAELRAEQLKRLVTDAIPILVVHPICDSVLTYYEIDMIRRETRWNSPSTVNRPSPSNAVRSPMCPCRQLKLLACEPSL